MTYGVAILALVIFLIIVVWRRPPQEPPLIEHLCQWKIDGNLHIREITRFNDRVKVRSFIGKDSVWYELKPDYTMERCSIIKDMELSEIFHQEDQNRKDLLDG